MKPHLLLSQITVLFKPAVATLLTILLAAPGLPAQSTIQVPNHVHQAPIHVKGVEHPEQVTDQRAWMMLMLGTTSVESDSDAVKEQSVLHRKALGLDSEQSVLDAARVHFDQLHAAYNQSPRAVADQLKHQSQIDALTKELIDTLYAHVGPARWKSIDTQVQDSKIKMGFTIDPPPDDDAELIPAVFRGIAHLLTASSSNQTVWSGSSAGYTYYSQIDTDGVKWYSTVYVYGTSNGQWTCIWDQYHGQWQPPGCPARHDFYLTNQINGTGVDNYYVGEEQSPTQYVSYAYGWSAPIVNGYTTWDNIKTGVNVVCTIAGTILAAYITWGAKEAISYFQWTGSETILGNGYIDCTVNKKCDNTGQHYAIDGPYVVDAPSCKPAYSCRGFCYRNPINGSWTCPSDFPPDLQPAVCFSVPLGTHGQCTIHP